MSESMNENAIEFLRGEKTATLTLAGNTRFNNKMRKLAEKYPDECQIIHENDDGSILVHCPVKWISISRRAGRELTDEQKNAGRERLLAYHAQRRMSL